MQRNTELTQVRRATTILPSRPEVYEELSIRGFLEIVDRRRMIIGLTFVCCVAVAMLLFTHATRLYKGSAEIQIQKESADALGLNNVMGPSEAASDSVEANVTLQTQAKILQSPSLALGVIKKLDLEKTADFKPKFSLMGWALGLFSAPGSPDPAGATIEDSPGRRNHVVQVFESHLKVTPISGTRLIDVEYLSSDRVKAAAAANLLVQDLIDYNFQTRQSATALASGWLSEQLSELRKRSEDLQAQVIDLQRDSGVFAMGQTDPQGKEQVYTPALDRLQQATAQLAQAESARIMKGALYQVVQNGDPELISGLAGNSTLTSTSSGIAGSLTVLQGLRAQEAQTQAQLNQLSEKFGPTYPKLKEIQASLEATKQSIKQEADRIAARVKNDYLVAEQVERADRATYQNEKTQAESSNGKAIKYEIVSQEATQSRSLYGNLLQRLKEADLVAGLHSSNITLVDAAVVPARPSKPALLIYLAGGVGGGLFLATCMGLLSDAMDNRIQGVQDLQGEAASNPIAFLPHYHAPSAFDRLRGSRNSSVISFRPKRSGCLTTNRTDSMVAAISPRAPYTEALRALRTTLTQGKGAAESPQVILVTSSIPGEGKSMLSMNLAIVYAQAGKKVLLVDGDLRTPVLHTRLNVSGAEGLGSIFHAPPGYSAILKPHLLSLEEGRSLHFIPAGPQVDYPAELLSSDQIAEMVDEWRRTYDYIFIDCAPLLPVTDSALLSRYADFTIVVARHRKTDRISLERTCQILRAQGIQNIGVVLNGVRASSGAQYGYYGYKKNLYQKSVVNA